MTAALVVKRKSPEQRVLAAALAWWRSGRPCGWDLRQHLKTPMVNRHGNDWEKNLALEIGNYRARRRRKP